MDTPASSIALFGATGLVGSHCLRLLVHRATFTRILVTGRRPLPSPPPDPPIEEYVVDLDHLDQHPLAVRAEVIICALGTTIRKAGSRDAFRQVDHAYPLAVARLGLEQGARHFLLVSALGADPGARIFYNRVKGDVERDLRALPYPSVTIVRPSLLLGERAEFRLGEELAKRLSLLVPGKYRPIAAATVARALVHEAQRTTAGVRVLESPEMRQRFG